VAPPDATEQKAYLPGGGVAAERAAAAAQIQRTVRVWRQVADEGPKQEEDAEGKAGEEGEAAEGAGKEGDEGKEGAAAGKEGDEAKEGAAAEGGEKSPEAEPVQAKLQSDVARKIFLAGDGRPGNNQDQNRQFREAVRRVNRQLGRNLTPDEEQEFHHAAGDESRGLEELVALGMQLFQGRGGNQGAQARRDANRRGGRRGGG
jgi:hypothetical protein